MKFRGSCGLCGKIWQVVGQPVGPGPYNQMACPLDGKAMYMVKAEDLPDHTPLLNFQDLIKNPQNAQLIVDFTETKWPSWYKNFAENLPEIQNGLNLSQCPKRKGPALIVGAGPSLYRNQHLDIIAKRRDEIPTLIVTDRMLKPCVERGIIPDF